MPARRLLMRKIREVLRLKHEQGLSHQAVAQACAVGVGTVNRYLQRAAQRGLGARLTTSTEPSPRSTLPRPGTVSRCTQDRVPLRCTNRCSPCPSEYLPGLRSV